MMKLLITFALFSLVYCKSKCDYEKCPTLDQNKINVHLIPHTHDDVGWLKTVDQYYYGMKNEIQRAGVQYILDSVVKSLLEDHTKRFIYVETAFFWKWWQEQDTRTQAQVKTLVDEGRLEFIGGGWSMNDEGCAHYSAIIDQMTLGNRKLVNLFGECGITKVAWQIDPFGHSKEQALLFAKMGFDGLFFGRLDYTDKTLRQLEKRMEFIWEASDEDKIRGHLFTGILPNGYSPPKGFCFDDLCADDPIIDNVNSEEYNVNKRVKEFLDAVTNQSMVYASNHLIMTMGEDFNYQNAQTWFKNLDKLIKYVNAAQNKVNVFYSTPSCYLYSLNKANLTWTVKDDDFFPYASDPHAYWSGYFTSRPASKGFIRSANNYLQAVKQLQVISKLHDNRTLARVNLLQEALGINQHHDAVTGTEKQHVTNDYTKILYNAKVKSEKVISDAYENFVSVHQQFCNNLNISECSITENNESLRISIYNPFAHPVNHVIRLPWTSKSYSIIGPNDEPIEADLTPIPKYVLNIPGRISKAQKELVFKVSLPSLGYTTYFVNKTAHLESEHTQRMAKNFRKTRRLNRNKKRNSIHTDDGHSIFKSKSFSLLLDEETGLFSGIKLQNGKQFKFDQSFRYYNSMAGKNRNFDDRASGAYIFRPNGTSHEMQPIESKVHSVGQLTEIHQTFNEWISQTVRVDENEDYIEFDWVIGPIPIDDGIGKEIVAVYATDLKTDKTFYTDSNGRQLLKRVRDYRPTWDYKVTEPIAGNYYPVNSRIIIKDENQKLQLSLLTDRTQGASSIVDGSVELMVHRRCLYDDAFGVGEALNETGYDGRGLVIRGKHYLIASTIEDGGKLQRIVGQKVFYQPIISFANLSIPSSGVNMYSELITPLPENINLLTLEYIETNQILLRLEHFFSGGDDPDGLSKPSRIDLRKIFKTFKVIGSTEMSLNANRPLSHVKRLQWRTNDTLTKESSPINPVGDFVITLRPMQIRTWILQIKLN